MYKKSMQLKLAPKKCAQKICSPKPSTINLSPLQFDANLNGTLFFENSF